MGGIRREGLGEKREGLGQGQGGKGGKKRRGQSRAEAPFGLAGGKNPQPRFVDWQRYLGPNCEPRVPGCRLGVPF